MNKSLTLENLNNSYISLIKMVLNGSFPVQSQLIHLFYRNPSPQDAYQLLQKIISKQESIKDAQNQSQLSQVNSIFLTPTKTNILVDTNTRVQKNKPYSLTNTNDIKYTDKFESQLKNKKEKSSKQNSKEDNQENRKLQVLKQVTEKLRQIFSDNNKKIIQYAETIKNPVILKPEMILGKRQYSFRKQ